MTDPAAVDLALLIFRCGIGGVMLAHGINHIWGGGRINGTASWFGSMGMRQPRAQAWLASLTEIAGGAMLVLGVLTPFGAAAVVGTMFVAWAINHRGNGFFILRPGEGWEYVMTLGSAGMLLGAVGAGAWSLDSALGLRSELAGWTGLAISIGCGLGGATAVLATFWRPQHSTD